MTKNKTERSACLSEFNANLSQDLEYFTTPMSSKPHLHVVVGDAHGNWFKLIHNALAIRSVISSDPHFFLKLRLLYDALNQAPLTTDQFMDYLALLKTCSLKPGIKDIFLGDTRCDRGQNDILTLAWFAHLDELKSIFRIIFSNHDFDGCRPKIYFDQELKNMSEYEKLFNISRVNMDKFLEFNKDNAEIMNLYHHYEEVYNQHLVLIDYTVTEEKNVLLYTHAGCGLETIEALAQKYNVSYQESRIEDLVHTINQINITFKRHLAKDFNWDLLYQNNADQPDQADPLFNVIATRQLRMDFREQPHNRSYRVEKIHGHNGQEPYIKSIPVFLISFPMSQPLPPNIQAAILRNDAILISSNSEAEAPQFFLIGVNNQQIITVVDFLSAINLDQSQQPLQDSLISLQEESKEKLLALGADLKKIAKTDQTTRFDLPSVFKKIPFMKEYLNHLGIARYHKPMSLTSLDGDLGKTHSLTSRDGENKWFEKTHTIKFLSSAPHPKYHPEAKVKREQSLKRSSSPDRFFLPDCENIDPNSPERPKKNRHSATG